MLNGESGALNCGSKLNGGSGTKDGEKCSESAKAVMDSEKSRFKVPHILSLNPACNNWASNLLFLASENVYFCVYLADYLWRPNRCRVT